MVTFRVLCSRLHTHFDRTQDEVVQVAGDAVSMKEVVDLTTDSRSDTSEAAAEESNARDTSIGALTFEDCAALPTDSRVLETDEGMPPLSLQGPKTPHLWSDFESEDGASSEDVGDTPMCQCPSSVEPRGPQAELIVATPAPLPHPVLQKVKVMGQNMTVDSAYLHRALPRRWISLRGSSASSLPWRQARPSSLSHPHTRS